MRDDREERGSCDPACVRRPRLWRGQPRPRDLEPPGGAQRPRAQRQRRRGRGHEGLRGAAEAPRDAGQESGPVCLESSAWCLLSSEDTFLSRFHVKTV